MNVASVQRHLRELSALVADAGANRKSVGELAAVADALEPFRDRTVGELADLLRRMAEPAGGELPESAPARPRGARPASSSGPVVPSTEAVQRLSELYKTALSPDLTPERMTEELKLLDGLKKDDLLRVAAVMGTQDALKRRTVPDIRKALEKAIRDRRGMYRRPDY